VGGTPNKNALFATFFFRISPICTFFPLLSDTFQPKLIQKLVLDSERMLPLHRRKKREKTMKQTIRGTLQPVDFLL
jgi:hypothetical protein